jgi:hypothetical protein
VIHQDWKDRAWAAHLAVDRTYDTFDTARSGYQPRHSSS